MNKQNLQFGSTSLLLPVLLCEMLTLCTAEERRDLYKGLAKVSNRTAIGAIFETLYKAAVFSVSGKAPKRISGALSIPACIVVNRLISKPSSEWS